MIVKEQVMVVWYRIVNETLSRRHMQRQYLSSEKISFNILYRIKMKGSGICFRNKEHNTKRKSDIDIILCKDYIFWTIRERRSNKVISMGDKKGMILSKLNKSFDFF